MKDVGVLVLRLTVGGLLAGHGAQKLFGLFGGHGIKGTGGWLESMGFKPGERWAMMAGLSEFGGGMLTALGLGGGMGPAATVGAMGVATGAVHWGKPIWNTEGGAELPAINMAAATALALSGPGKYSLDRLFGIRVPSWVTGLAFGATVAGVYYATTSRELPAQQQQQPQGEAQDQQTQRPAQPERPERPEQETPADQRVQPAARERELPRAA